MASCRMHACLLPSCWRVLNCSKLIDFFEKIAKNWGRSSIGSFVPDSRPDESAIEFLRRLRARIPYNVFAHSSASSIHYVVLVFLCHA